MISALDHFSLNGQNEAVLRMCGFPTSAAAALHTRVRSDEVQPESESDEALMQRAAGGAESALAELYDRLAPRLLGLALTVLRDRRDAEDALQDAFVYAWQHA